MNTEQRNMLHEMSKRFTRTDIMATVRELAQIVKDFAAGLDRLRAANEITDDFTSHQETRRAANDLTVVFNRLYGLVGLPHATFSNPNPLENV